MLRKEGWEPSDYIKSLLDRDIERTADWLPTTPAPLTLQKYAIPSPSPVLTSNSTPNLVGGLASHFAAFTTADLDRPKRFKPIKPKIKAKTCGETTKEASEKKPEEKPEKYKQKAEDPPVFFGTNVDSRSAGVFGALFHKPGARGAGEVKWTDFLYAMTSVGFESEKLYGSVWQFSPSATAAEELKLVRSIHFHEPHPSSRIPFKVARRMGRRLRKRFAWTGDQV
ncbi:hypothetical protein PG993_007564 [Apiospora rasikravindrae]|uniref:Uncharacterized protein n=1 Tax=Apiospora rasikravindrae TaxID=990691 RepID=A0ABR1T048_9PEZI